MKSKFKVGQKVKVAQGNDNENYDSFRNKVLIICHIANSKSEHPGFDSEINESLYDFKTDTGEDVPFSLYDYEIELI